MLAERLKSLRTEKNLSQKQLAEEINTSQQNINHWESGNRNPKHETLTKLANFFNVSVDYLLGKTNLKHPNQINKDELKETLKKSVGYNGLPPTEEELENMANAFIEYMENKNL